MLPQIELFCVGFAAVVDTVLLLVVLERINRPLTAIWLKWALAGAALWHVGSFLHALLRETHGATADGLDAACMITMATGLLFLTSAVLHGALRLNRTGTVAHPPRDRRYIGIYVPAMFIVLVAATIIRSDSRDFIVATASFQLPYLIWLTFANLTAAGLLLKNRDRFTDQSASARRFLIRFSIGVVAVTLLVNTYILFAHKSTYEPWLRLLTNLSPLAPTLIFAYYIFRRRLLPMVFERTLVYGALLLAVFYLHRLTLSPLMNKYSQELQFDFVVVEGLLLVALVLAYEPLRNRFREGLRYFIGTDVTEVRDASRGLSVELSRRAGDDVDQISSWFAEGLLNALHLRYTFLTSDDIASENNVAHIAEGESDTGLEELLNPGQLANITSKLSTGDRERWIDRSRCHDAEQLAVMRKLDLMAAFRIKYRNVNGFLLLGAPTTGDRLSDEQLNTISLLVDQYAATVHNRQLEQARQMAERRAIQQEKLSTLGLLSGSLAHELKNPLSSMRTIATLLGEDLDDGSEQSKDVELIVAEIDRLTQTTQRLLDFSRPADAVSTGVSPDRVIERLMHILAHLAKQHAVTVTLNLHLGESIVTATDASMSEIMFNLIKNGIEAVRGTEDPTVDISTYLVPTSEPQSVEISVTDNGPGIAAELQDQIFEPFVTGKTDGTGLGLYLVGERVRELNGTIKCTSDAKGTDFRVRLPILR